MTGWLRRLFTRPPQPITVEVTNCSPTATGYRVLYWHDGVGPQMVQLTKPREVGAFYTIDGEKWTREPE